MPKKKITDEELLEELQKGKTEKEIAYDNGYGYPSSALNRRLQELGYRKNRKLTIQGNGGATLYIGSDLLETLTDAKDLNPEEHRLFMDEKKVEKGEVVFEITDRPFKKEEDE